MTNYPHHDTLIASTTKHGEIMIQVGDLVQSRNTGDIGIVTRRDLIYVNYYYVQFPNGTYTTHIQNLKPLETI